MRPSEYTAGRVCDKNIAGPEGRLFAGAHGMPADRGSSCSAPITKALRKLPEKLTSRAKRPTQVQYSSDSAIPFFGNNIQTQGPYCYPRFSPSRSTKAMIYFLRGVVGIWVVFSLAATAAPTAVRQSFVVTAQVLPIDCTARLVRTKACAPVIVTTETPQPENGRSGASAVVTTETPRTENARSVVTTVLYY
jgi:hypothetical protein